MAESNGVQSANNDVAAQSSNMNSAGTQWWIIAHGTMEHLKELFPTDSLYSIEWVNANLKRKLSIEDQLVHDSRVQRRSESDGPQRLTGEDTQGGQTNVFERGPVGENVLHLSLLLGNDRTREMALYLIDVFGSKLINTPYQTRKLPSDPPGLYEGETIVHIAIVNKDVAMLRLLIERGADLEARAYGKFFQKSGNCYYGEYPLSFAVCLRSKKMTRVLMETGKCKINEHRDIQGNTALHMAVIHSLPDMYDYLVDVWEADQTVKNKDALTPFTLAAEMNNEVMFKHIFAKQRIVQWMYGPVTCYAMPLREFDTVQDDEDTVSALDIIVSEGHHNLLTDGFIVSMLAEKWKRFGKFYFWLTFGAYVMLMTAFSIMVLGARTNDPSTLSNIFLSHDVVCKWSLMCYDHHTRYLETLEFNGRDEEVTNQMIAEVKLRPPEDIRPAIASMLYDVINASWPGAAEEGGKAGKAYIKARLSDTIHLSNVVESQYTPLMWGLEIFVALGALGFCVLEVYDFVAQKAVYDRRLSLRDQEVQLAPGPPPTVHIPGSVSLNKQIKMSRAPTSRMASLLGGISGRAVTDATQLYDADDDGIISEDEARRAKMAGVALQPRPLERSLQVLGSVANVIHPTSVFLWVFICTVAVHFWYWAVEKKKPFVTEGAELSIAAVAGWNYILYFTRGVEPVGHLVVMVVRMLGADVVKFAAVYLVFLLSFSQAFTLLVTEEWYNEDIGDVKGDFSSLTMTMMTLFRFTLGDLEYDAFRRHSSAGLVNTFFICFSVISNVLMINLLIAMMGNTFAAVSDNASQVWRLQWARFILLIERRLGREAKHRFRLGEKQEMEGVTAHFHVFEEVSKDDGARDHLLDDDEGLFDDKDDIPPPAPTMYAPGAAIPPFEGPDLQTIATASVFSRLLQDRAAETKMIAKTAHTSHMIAKTAHTSMLASKERMNRMRSLRSTEGSAGGAQHAQHAQGKGSSQVHPEPSPPRSNNASPIAWSAASVPAPGEGALGTTG
mmetsp:Transcript_622/g.2031  ORF Transcript_622/g.2031 Transcript_622/m.2031 type:complete len:1008 (-) Transcript_622:2227-5250(-)